MHRLQDTFVRLSIDEILTMDFVHILSRIDLEPLAVSQACGSATTITGYTEWVSACEPCITLGWDWALAPSGIEFHCVRIGSPRSNVLLVDSHERDYPWSANLLALSTVVDAFAWTEHTMGAISREAPA